MILIVPKSKIYEVFMLCHSYIFFQQSFQQNENKGCLDYLIHAQQRELEGSDRPVLDDKPLKGLPINFLSAGIH